MLWQALNRFAAVAVFFGTSLAAQGQEQTPPPLAAKSLADGNRINLVHAWRYHPGDDPRWADPAFDDTGWELVELPPDEHSRDGWLGAGWFRRHLRLEPALRGQPLVIRVETFGTTAVFLDGAPLMSAEASGLAPQAGARRPGSAWREVVFSTRPDHALAVRHVLAPAGQPGFRLSVERSDAAAFKIAADRRRTLLLALPAFLAAFLALLHLALFLSYSKARENLFYALTMAALAAMLVSMLLWEKAASVFWGNLGSRAAIPSVLAALFFLLLTYYAVRTPTFPRTWIAFAAAGLTLLGLTLLRSDPHASMWTWYLYFGLVTAEIIRVEATGRTVAREGARVLLGGLAIFGVTFVLQILVILHFVPMVPILSNIFLLGMLALALAMSLFLVQGFARTSRDLERRLVEVHALSEQVLAQERAGHEQELRRRLLEVENARKTSEIEAARTLQLSMLPATLPAVEGLETAAAMSTASEVGGDYYDFRVAPDGSLVVAFGDATGHGVAAGIMVTAVKALFSALGGAESLSSVLAECGRVLREMHVKPHMCLTLARLTPRAVTLCSAAMPPVLIHRAGSGEIEELGNGGPPVGSRLSGVWNECSASLAPGDTLLFASDGFAEQLDAADQLFGYERMAEVFRASACEPAGELVERLLAQVSAWRGEREQGDDITLVVVRATS